MDSTERRSRSRDEIEQQAWLMARIGSPTMDAWLQGLNEDERQHLRLFATEFIEKAITAFTPFIDAYGHAAQETMRVLNEWWKLVPDDIKQTLEKRVE